jgi:uncharacterized damage-inducible protein DinB
MSKIVLALVLAIACAAAASAQSMGMQAQAGDPQLAAFKMQFDFAKKYVTASAEKIPQDLYSFQPTPEVRTVARILAHIADANYMFCSGAKGEPSPREMGSIEKSVEKATTKAAVQKELADSFAYCEAAFSSLQPAQFADKVEFFGMPQTKLSLLNFSTVHGFEHYGNLVTYMRMKNIVPPSSEKPPAPSPQTSN